MAVEDKVAFKYDNQKQLKQLIGLLADKSIELSAWAFATAPEEFHNLHNKINEVSYKGSLCTKEELKVLKSLTKEISEWSKQLKIFPFTSLEFNEIYRTAQIKHNFPYYDYDNRDNQSDLSLFIDSNPLNIINNNFRFYSIQIRELREKKDINLAKNVLINLDENQYKIKSLNAGLNPSDYTSDHYYGGTSYDGQLWVNDGLIEITGMKINKDKFIENITKIGMNQQ